MNEHSTAQPEQIHRVVIYIASAASMPIRSPKQPEQWGHNSSSTFGPYSEADPSLRRIKGRMYK